jgi:hypothetical protein
MKSVFFAILLFASDAVWAMNPYFHVIGVVKSFDAKTVSFQSSDTIWQIPRGKFEEENLRVGQHMRVRLKKIELGSYKHKKA